MSTQNLRTIVRYPPGVRINHWIVAICFVLAALSGGPAHGYAVIQQVRLRSGGAFDLPEGTIYPALHRLEDAGLLSSAWADGDGRRRRVYALTSAGATALAAERTEWRRFAHGVRAVTGWSM